MPEFDGDPRNHGFQDMFKAKLPELPNSIADLIKDNLKIGEFSEAERVIKIYKGIYNTKPIEEEYMFVRNEYLREVYRT